MIYRSFEAKIQWATGVSLTEHRVETHLDYHQDEIKGPLRSCYIPSVEGRRFQILIRNKHKTTVYSCTVCLDGANSHFYTLYPGAEMSLKGIEIEGRVRTVRPFIFSKLGVSDDHDAVTPITGKRNMDLLGTIGFYIYPVRIADSDEDVTDTECNGPHAPPKNFIVSKGTKPDVTNCIVLADEEVRVAKANTEPVVLDYLTPDPFKNPSAILRFHYFPQEVLQAKGIIPWKQGQQRIREASEDQKPSILPVIDTTNPSRTTRTKRQADAETNMVSAIGPVRRRITRRARMRAESIIQQPRDLLTQPATLHSMIKEEEHQESGLDSEDELEVETMLEVVSDE